MCYSLKHKILYFYVRTNIFPNIRLVVMTFVSLQVSTSNTAYDKLTIVHIPKSPVILNLSYSFIITMAFYNRTISYR